MAAAFVHRTSRAGDPQLHTHVLVANVARGSDGTWSAPDARLVYFHARTAGFLYEAALRAGLTQALGVAFGPVTRGIAELDGVPKTLLRAFSTRRREIERHLASGGRALGQGSRKWRRSPPGRPRIPLVTLSTARVCASAGSTKPPDLGFADLSLGTTVLDRLLGAQRVVSSQRRAGRPNWWPRSIGPEGLTAGAAAFERRDVVRALADALVEGAPVEVIESMAEAALARPEVVELASVGRGGELRHTTLELLDVERRLLRDVAQTQGAGISTVSADSAGHGARVGSHSSPPSRSTWCVDSRPRATAQRWWWERRGRARRWPWPRRAPPGRHRAPR